MNETKRILRKFLEEHTIDKKDLPTLEEYSKAMRKQISW